jgi:2-polyprenyl-6-hydroxyphenyl methylase/3-demethylubiquinone-9 3-methyltransferase
MPEAFFSFGKNWEKYIRKSFSEKRLAIAKKWLLEFLQLSNFEGRIFIDIGCGSGIHSLAAWEAGAQRVIGIDIDQDSIRAAETLRQRRDNPENWEIHQGSILDDSLAHNIPLADIVYSWGVLHHTGNLWKAIENSAKFLKPNALFYIAIYEKNAKSNYWISVKSKYNASGWWRCWEMEMNYLLKYFFWPPNPKKIFTSFWYIASYKIKRGMSFMTDVRDWLGGWPYEPATEKEICDFCENKLGLRKIRIKTGEANIEYLFQQPAHK